MLWHILFRQILLGIVIQHICWRWKTLSEIKPPLKFTYRSIGLETPISTTPEFGSKLQCTEKSRNRLWFTMPVRWLPLLKSKLLSTKCTDKRTDVWSQPSCIYTQIFSPKKNVFFTFYGSKKICGMNTENLIKCSRSRTSSQLS